MSAIIRVLVFGFALMGILLLPSCEEVPCDCEGPEDQPVYFEYHYQNWAWGYQESGWLIDSAGVVKGFHMPESFREADSTGLISTEDLLIFYIAELPA